MCASLWAQVEASIRVGMSSIDSLPCFVERGAHTELELFQQSVQPVSPLGLPIHTPSPTTLRAVLGLQAWASVQTFRVGAKDPNAGPPSLHSVLFTQRVTPLVPGCFTFLLNLVFVA